LKTTTAITTVKRDVQLQEWTEQIKAQQESGMTVTAYCAQNGINIKTYYYRLKRMRQAVCNEIGQHDIVPVEENAVTETNNTDINQWFYRLKKYRASSV
jgi:hypothetical protein